LREPRAGAIFPREGSDICVSGVSNHYSGAFPFQMATEKHNPWLHRLAVFAAACTLGLIGLGAIVTSKEAGMAVPDWPQTLGHNMFFVPFKLWVGVSGIFEEHSHRLAASFVGLLTTILAVWLWLRDDRQWVRRLGVIAFFLVVGQGVMGGLRVTQMNQNFGILHGMMAQIFLLVMVCLALVTSRWWKRTPAAESNAQRAPRVVRMHFIMASVLIFAQLALGATMRHQHAGLSAWDFPKAHGQWWPATDAESVARYNAERAVLNQQLYEEGQQVFLMTGRDILPFHLTLQMVHRVLAVLILALVIGTLMVARKRLGASHALSRLSLVWLGVIGIQVALGILTVLKYKPADIATLHVVCGALALGTGAIGSFISRQKHLPSRVVESAPETKANMEATA
jgi:cytochrome c oxidase assembly protein subunit 15